MAAEECMVLREICVKHGLPKSVENLINQIKDSIIDIPLNIRIDYEFEKGSVEWEGKWVGYLYGKKKTRRFEIKNIQTIAVKLEGKMYLSNTTKPLRVYECPQIPMLGTCTEVYDVRIQIKK